MACAEGCLDQVEICWKDGAAACVVLASGGYPGKYSTGFPIAGLEAERPNAVVFHAGTKYTEGKVVSAGGRVLCVTGLGADIRQALRAAYERIQPIRFEGMQYRTDIGWRVLGEK
jgi:phosphoribosylamine--glycine ligase